MWLAVFGRILFGERIPVLAAVGIAVGLVGRRDPRLARRATSARWIPAGLLALIVSPMFWSLGTLYAARRAVLPTARPASRPASRCSPAAWRSSSAAVLTGELRGFDPAAVSATSWFGIAYLVVVGSLVGFTTYAWLLTVAPLGRVATYAYVNPVVAVILGSIDPGRAADGADGRRRGRDRPSRSP